MSMVKRLLIVVAVCFVLAVAAAAAAGLYFKNWLNSSVPAHDGTVFVVERGQSFSHVTAALHQVGLVDEPLLLRLYGRISGLETRLRAGEYEIEPGLTVAGLVDHLASGDVIQHEVMLVEGRTLDESLAQWSDSRLKLTADEPRQTAITSLLQMKAPSSEGLFFSDTYFYEAGATDLDILRRAHERLVDVLEEEWQQRQPNLPYKTPYEALVMASIIERETAVPSERPVIAGVFVRRLQKGMRLQSDPTVIYGMGDNYDGRIRRKDLNTRTPWNTYRINGLPPTPIASVGRDAIHAALNPADGKALYFVARGDGTHVFNNTLAEHNRAVRKYQLNRRSDYRSTPDLPVAASEQDSE
ncbi:endolytic transglycosylase MltG [Parendozoicomonas haliclonae]|uniref:Endolytic murein transglycosylase n=1 Tax=Parendozoicomonas haliclonae TaxID=1960125 RepID=A0A1X7ALY8_9GAMM|nr:endolytic transglycosylase MltG [Parendozoicomonas haliclonae]SMA49155.1 putative aminodeoxychorismate lyase [Parendozoicomonas haliclonae]